MTDYTELQRLAEHHLSLGHAYTVATPSAVLALIAENERLRESDQEATELCDTLSVLLGEIAVAVRGPEEPKSRHGFHDLPSRVKTVVAERDQLRAAISTPESVFINMKSGRIARISLRSAIDLHGEVINGDDAQQIEIARLRAEVAGLRTGYEAYEQVNAEMKAEVEVLRKDADRAAYWKQRAKSAEGHLFSGDFRAAAMELHKYSRFESTPWPELTGSQHALISSAAGAVIATVNRLRDARRPKNRDETDAIIWCACGDGHAANSYGAGFMDANGGVCANCDAAMGNGGRGGQSTSKTSESAYPEGLKGGGQ